MKNRISVLLLIAAALLSSCNSQVKSLNPFYTNETVAEDSRMVGDWVIQEDSTTVYRITPFTCLQDSTTTVPGYQLREMPVTRLPINPNHPPKNRFVYSKGRYYLYHRGMYRGNTNVSNPTLVHLFKLPNGKLYWDLTGFSNSGDDDFEVLIHNLAQVDLRKNAIVINWLSQEAIAGNLKKNLVKIPMQKFTTFDLDGHSQENTLITAEPKQLQKFIQKYDERLFADSSKVKFVRVVFK